MGKFFSFGKYNKLYKYIWIAIIFKLIYEYLFSHTFPDQIRFNFLNTKNYPPDILVQLFFNYLGSFFIGILLFLYEKKGMENVEKKTDKGDQSSIALQNLFQKTKIIHNVSYKKFRFKTIIIISFLSVVVFQVVMKIFLSNNIDVVVYWVVDLFFLAEINLIMFGVPIYAHKKCALIFIFVFSSIFKFLSTFEILFNDEYELIYKYHVTLIPIVAISYFCVSLLRFYVLTKVKVLFDNEYLPVSLFFTIYNLVGAIILLIGSLIATNIKCIDIKKFKGINLFCRIAIKNGDKVDYYFDNFSYFFEQLWRKEKSLGENFLYLILFIIKVILNGIILFYSMLQVKHLSAEYYQVYFQILYFIIRFIVLAKYLIDGTELKLHIYSMLSDFGSVVGTMIYLELIELKFFQLDQNIKKNIEMRSLTEYSTDNLYNNEDNDTDIDNNAKDGNTNDGKDNNSFVIYI